jgi:Protein of unknown function (DUF1565)
MLHPTIKQPRRLGGLAIRVLFALAVAGLPGCGDQSPTDPGEPAAQAAQPEELAADLSADQSAATPTGASALAVTATATRLPKSFFVNPTTGKDTNAGTKLQPFKTLARGLSTAIAGDTMRLASGVYSAATNGEKFTNGTQQVVVPAGVTILGTIREDSTSQLHGATGDVVGLNLKGAATVRNVILSGFGHAIVATQGVQSLKNLILDQNLLGLDLSGSAKTTLVSSSVFLTAPSANMIGAIVRQQAQFTMVGGTMSGGAPNCRTGVIGMKLDNAARLTLKNGATLKEIAGPALAMVGASKALLTGLATIDRNLSQFPGCPPTPSVLTDDSTSLTLKKARVFSAGGANSVGIEPRGRTLLTLDSAQVKGHTGAGLRTSRGNPRIVVNGSLFQANIIGIDAVLTPTASLTITGSTVSNNVTGIHAPFFKLRKSLVTSNQTGILVASFSSDLGQPGDPGNNLIAANSNTGVTWDANIISSKAGGIFAVGNTWNPGIQGSDGNGKYSPQVLSGSSPLANGTNFKLPGFSFQIQL